jgi:hypothetical protein
MEKESVPQELRGQTANVSYDKSRPGLKWAAQLPNKLAKEYDAAMREEGDALYNGTQV